jgi:hypothetical protein
MDVCIHGKADQLQLMLGVVQESALGLAALAGTVPGLVQVVQMAHRHPLPLIR